MKVFSQYMLMVSIPLVVVFGLLQLGRNLKAPVSVGGAWSLDLSSQSMVAGACDNALTWTEPPILTITQSGPYISLDFNDTQHTKLDGHLEGTDLSGGTSNTSNVNPGLQFFAFVDRQVEPDRLQIAMKLRGCSESISIVGTRLPRKQGSGGH
jgi:hypothetical protein